MEEFEMTQTELILFLETLAENVELKAKTGEDAAGIIRKKIEVLKKKPRHLVSKRVSNP